ncbi:MAG: NAD(P)H-hydrate dehydratase [Betaproteobacteria bacterium]|nr:NAD(P)H-hydrate dehydratase [Betaproteobacteria bacterium]
MSDLLCSSPQPVYRAEAIRRIEAAAFACDPPPPLMERAGTAAGTWARDILGSGDRVLVLAGPGNNGGDAFVAARHLRENWIDVTVAFKGDESKLSGDAVAALAAWRRVGGTEIRDLPPIGGFSMVIDGLFGIGLERTLTGTYAKWVDTVNEARIPAVLALDVPSGLHSDSGAILGTCIRATHTLTFIALKAGLLTLDGPDHAGLLRTDALELDVPALVPADAWLLDDRWIRRALPPRRRNTHKGTYGSLVVAGGAEGMMGAALLAGRAALLCGAGRVYVVLLSPDALSVDPAQPELMLRPASGGDLFAGASALCVGPGLGQTDAAATVVERALRTPLPLLLDADALNLIAADADLAHALANREAPSVLTPHPAEAARLLSVSTADVQKDRVASAREIARRLRAWVVLKGAGSVCTAPDGRWFLNNTGNPGMAVAGMGDVLSGVVSSLLAQGRDVEDALLGGVRLHGLAGDHTAQHLGGQVGITAGEVALACRTVANRICR